MTTLSRDPATKAANKPVRNLWYYPALGLIVGGMVVGFGTLAQLGASVALGVGVISVAGLSSFAHRRLSSSVRLPLSIWSVGWGILTLGLLVSALAYIVIVPEGGRLGSFGGALAPFSWCSSVQQHS